MRELSVEEQKELDRMSQGNKVVNTTFKFPEDWQRKLLACIFDSPGFAKKVFPILEPTYFSSEYHAMFFEIAKDYYEKYSWQKLNKSILETELAEKQKDKEKQIQLLCRVELNVILEYHTEEMYAEAYLYDKVLSWARRSAGLLAHHKFMVDCEEGKLSPEEAIEKQIARQKEILNMSYLEDDLMEWQDIVDNLEEEDWLIKNWLEFGSIAMLCGYAFAGKSSILVEIFAAAIKTGKFGPYEVPKTPILLVDAENKLRILHKRLGAALDGDFDSLHGNIIKINNKTAQLPWSTDKAIDKLREKIEKVKKKKNSEKIFVVIDTMRSVFGADEMDTAAMKALLYPLQRMAQETNAAILILHHRPKNGSEFGGTTAIAAALDYQWVWESCKETKTAKLKMQGRGDPENDMYFEYLNGRNHYIPESVKNEETNGLLTELILNSIKENGVMTQTALVKEVSSLWKIKTDLKAPGKHKIAATADSLVGEYLFKEPGISHNSLNYSLIGKN